MRFGFVGGAENRHNPRVDFAKIIPWLAAGLILAKGLAELWLSHLNRKYALAHADAVPDAFKESIDAATYAKSVQYTLAKSRFGLIEDPYSHPTLLEREAALMK